MKILTCLLLIFAAHAHGDPLTIKEKDTVDELTTKSGTVYTNAKILKISKSGVRIMLPYGYKTIPTIELPQYKFLFDRIEDTDSDDNARQAPSVAPHAAKPTTPIKWNGLTLTDGKTYEDVTVTKIWPDGISLIHVGGAARVPYEKLTAESQELLGSFDAQQAASFRAAEEENDRRQAARNARLDDMQRKNAARNAAEPEPETDSYANRSSGYKSGTLRTWTDTKTGKTIEAELVAKSLKGTHVQLKTAESKTITIEAKTLSMEDQDYIKSQNVPILKRRPGGVRMSAKSIAWGTKRSSYSYVWGNVDSSGAQVLGYSERNKRSSRVLGIDLGCSLGSSGGDYVVEVFWFGFPLSSKRKRYVCAAAMDIVTVFPRKPISIAVSSKYNYRRTSLIYLESDPSFREWRGLYVRTWSGYTYAGWAVRVSDGFGKIVAVQGAQPSFLRHIDNISVPRIK